MARHVHLTKEVSETLALSKANQQGTKKMSITKRIQEHLKLQEDDRELEVIYAMRSNEPVIIVKRKAQP